MLGLGRKVGLYEPYRDGHLPLTDLREGAERFLLDELAGVGRVPAVPCRRVRFERERRKDKKGNFGYAVTFDYGTYRFPATYCVYMDAEGHPKNVKRTRSRVTFEGARARTGRAFRRRGWKSGDSAVADTASIHCEETLNSYTFGAYDSRLGETGWMCIDRDSGEVLWERYEPRITYARAFQLAREEYLANGVDPSAMRLSREEMERMYFSVQGKDGKPFDGDMAWYFYWYDVTVDVRTGMILPRSPKQRPWCGW